VLKNGNTVFSTSSVQLETKAQKRETTYFRLSQILDSTPFPIMPPRVYATNRCVMKISCIA